MTVSLQDALARQGYQGRVVSSQRCHDLREEIEARHRDGLLDEGVYQRYLSRFTFTPPEDMPDARSLIIVAAPQPQVRFTFTWNGRQTPVLVPPTYLHGDDADRQVAEALSAILQPHSYRVAQAALPEKLLATRSGLAAYGRNNITYVAGMGSFHRPAAFFSDLPCPQDDWQEPRMLERCGRCSACLRACPTGAIPADRFLLHAGRCLTFHNEKPAAVPFPAWLEPAWHNCLVGCLHCQRACPENRDCLDWVEEGAAFSAEETALLLQNTPLERFPTATVEKLERWDLSAIIDIFPRNLGVLLTH